MDAKPGLGSVEAENLVADVYKNATLPAGFKLDKSTDVIFNLPDFAAKTVLDDATKFRGIANMSELKPEFKQYIKEVKINSQTLANELIKRALSNYDSAIFHGLINLSLRFRFFFGGHIGINCCGDRAFIF